MFSDDRNFGGVCHHFASIQFFILNSMPLTVKSNIFSYSGSYRVLKVKTGWKNCLSCRGYIDQKYQLPRQDMKRLFVADNVLQELSPLLTMMQLTGLATHKTQNDAPASSKLLAVHSLVLASVVVYCFFSETARWQNSDLTIFMYHFLDTCQNCYLVTCFIKCVLKTKTSTKMWSKLHEVDSEIKRINGSNQVTTKLASLIGCASLLGLCFTFLILHHSLQSLEHFQFNFPYWVVRFGPTIESCWFELYFASLSFCLLRSCRSLNVILTTEAMSFEKQRWQFFRVRTCQLLRKIQAAREIHFKIFEATKYLNSIFGVHFLFMFAMFLIIGMLNAFHLIKLYMSEEPSSSQLFLMWFWKVVQFGRMAIVSYGGTALHEEVSFVYLSMQLFNY